MAETRPDFVVYGGNGGAMSGLEVFDGSQYLPIAGTPGPQTLAQVGGTAPTPREVGDIWVNTEKPLVKGYDDEWKYPVLLNGWVDYGASAWGSARYRKTPGGLVIVAGLIAGGSQGTAAFILPEEYSPYGRVTVPLVAWNWNPGRVSIDGGVGVAAPFFLSLAQPTWTSICCSFVVGSEFA